MEHIGKQRKFQQISPKMLPKTGDTSGMTS